MSNFDAATLIVVDAYVLALLGALLFVSAFQGMRERALLYMSFASILSALGLMVSLLRTQPALNELAVMGSNALLLSGHALVWATFRAFSNRPQRIGGLLAGGLAWLALSFWPVFMASAHFRIVMYSLICIAYLGLAAREVWRARARDQFGVVPALAVLGAQIVFNIYRMLAERVPPILGVDQSNFSLTMFESILFAISLSFVVLMMVRERAERQYRHAALHDDLTGLHNRRAFFDLATRALARAHARREDVVLLMCDLDWFKRINDGYGHVAGDCALVAFGKVLHESVRVGDVCARFGGEEFVVLALRSDLLQGVVLGNRIRDLLSGRTVELSVSRGHLGAWQDHYEVVAGRQSPMPVVQSADVPKLQIPSVSIGVASAKQSDYDLERLLARADEALYRAKAAGRDCVVVYE